MIEDDLSMYGLCEVFVKFLQKECIDNHFHVGYTVEE